MSKEHTSEIETKTEEERKQDKEIKDWYAEERKRIQKMKAQRRREQKALDSVDPSRYGEIRANCIDTDIKKWERELPEEDELNKRILAKKLAEKQHD